MKLSVSRKIIVEELPGNVRDWFTKVTTILNPFLEGVYQILNGGITLADNIKCETYTQTLQPGQTTLKLAYTLKERPTDVRITHIRNTSGAIAQAFSHTWQYVNGVLEVTFIGLDATKKYQLTLIAQV